MKHTLLVMTLSCLALSLGACAEDSPEEQDKGPEELPLSPEGKADSFFRPTEFGAMVFKESAEVKFEEDKIFHSWTFTLSGAGEFFVESDPDSKKTDTVMYLYRRVPGQQGWGRYIKKNDDRNVANSERSELSSRIDWSHKANDEEVEYRVIVKPYRKDTRGTYTLRSGCEGAGCFTDDVDSTLTCEGTDVVGVNFNFTQGCANALDALVRSTPVRPSKEIVECLEERVTELYKDTEVYDSIVDEYGEDEVNGDLSAGMYQAYELGAVLSVDAGGDEDGYTFILDQQGDLFLSRWENQSSINEWSCGDFSDEKHGDGDLSDTCMELITYNMGSYSAHAQDVIAQGSGLVGTDVSDEFAKIALAYASSTLNIKTGSPFTYSHTGKLEVQSMMTIESLDADGNNVRVDILQDLNWNKTSYNRYLYTTKVDKNVSFVCEQLDSVPVN